MIRFAGSFLAALASFLVEVGLALGRRQAAREIASDATREAEAARVAVGKAQAGSLYNLAYYAGSSVIGWVGGIAFDAAGWSAVAAVIVVLDVVAGLAAAAVLRD